MTGPVKKLGNYHKIVDDGPKQDYHNISSKKSGRCSVSANGSQYEVLSPWAEVDPIPLKGITPRLSDLKGKNIGLLINGKRASRPILSVVERKLKERYPTAIFSYFHPGSGAEAEDVEKREKLTLATWVKTVDAVVLAVGD
jgi:hypothetical protein